MADIIRRFVSRLVATAAARFLEQAGLDIDVAGLSARRRTKVVVDAIYNAGDEARGRLEAVAGHIMVLADQTDHAERALRIVCEDRPELLEILEADRSLEVRILEISLFEPKILDQARNLALTYHWKEGRRYCSRFLVENPAPIAQV